LRLLRGEKNHRGSTATEAPAGGGGNARTSWRAGKAPTGGLERWNDIEATRGRGEEQEVGAGNQERLTALAAERQKQSRRGRGARKKKGERIEPRTVLQYQRKAGTSL
jgi:hypothetical protein